MSQFLKSFLMISVLSLWLAPFSLSKDEPMPQGLSPSVAFFWNAFFGPTHMSQIDFIEFQHEDLMEAWQEFIRHPIVQQRGFEGKRVLRVELEHASLQFLNDLMNHPLSLGNPAKYLNDRLQQKTTAKELETQLLFQKQIEQRAQQLAQEIMHAKYPGEKDYTRSNGLHRQYQQEVTRAELSMQSQQKSKKGLAQKKELVKFLNEEITQIWEKARENYLNEILSSLLDEGWKVLSHSPGTAPVLLTHSSLPFSKPLGTGSLDFTLLSSNQPDLPLQLKISYHRNNLLEFSYSVGKDPVPFDRMQPLEDVRKLFSKNALKKHMGWELYHEQAFLPEMRKIDKSITRYQNDQISLKKLQSELNDIVTIAEVNRRGFQTDRLISTSNFLWTYVNHIDPDYLKNGTYLHMRDLNIGKANPLTINESIGIFNLKKIKTPTFAVSGKNHSPHEKFLWTNEARIKNALVYTLSKKEKANISVKSLELLEPVQGKIIIPTPDFHRVSALTVFSGKTKLNPGKDYELMRSQFDEGFFIEIKPHVLPFVINNGIGFEADFSKDAEPPSLKVLEKLDIDSIHEINAQLREAGFNALANTLDEQLRIREQKNTALSVFELESILKETSLYAQTPFYERAQINVSKTNPFYEFSQYLNPEGIYCTQCTGSMALQKRILELYLKPYPHIGVQDRNVFVLENGTLSRHKLHAQLEVRFVGKKLFVLDSTPTRLLEDYRPDKRESGDALKPSIQQTYQAQHQRLENNLNKLSDYQKKAVASFTQNRFSITAGDSLSEGYQLSIRLMKFIKESKDLSSDAIVQHKEEFTEKIRSLRKQLNDINQDLIHSVKTKRNPKSTRSMNYKSFELKESLYGLLSQMEETLQHINPEILQALWEQDQPLPYSCILKKVVAH